MDGRRKLFEVLYPKTGKAYTIYEDGEIEGFEPGAAICNHHQTLLAQALALQELHFRDEGGVRGRVRSIAPLRLQPPKFPRLQPPKFPQCLKG